MFYGLMNYCLINVIVVEVVLVCAVRKYVPARYEPPISIVSPTRKPRFESIFIPSALVMLRSTNSRVSPLIVTLNDLLLGFGLAEILSGPDSVDTDGSGL